MQRIFRLHGNCWECTNPILQGHVDNKFCSKECIKKFYNDINNASTALKKKIHPLIEQHHGERSPVLLSILERNDKVLRKIICYFDFDFLPVPRLLLKTKCFDFGVYTATEVNPQTDGRIYWIYAIGIEVGSDWENLTIQFRNSDGSLRQMKNPFPDSH